MTCIHGCRRTSNDTRVLGLGVGRDSQKCWMRGRCSQDLDVKVVSSEIRENKMDGGDEPSPRR